MSVDYLFDTSVLAGILNQDKEQPAMLAAAYQEQQRQQHRRY
jgi:hypothetical protein